MATLSVFPNPAAAMFNVAYRNNVPANGEIEVTDTFGKTVKQLRFYQSTNEVYPINGSELSNGVYVVTLKTKDQTLTQRIVVAK